MSIAEIIGLVLLFSGGICSIVAGVLYNAPIQRYLEKLGKNPAFLGFSLSGLQDYWSAKQLAKRWGHEPPFLRRYGRMLLVAFVLFATGAILVLSSML